MAYELLEWQLVKGLLDSLQLGVYLGDLMLEVGDKKGVCWWVCYGAEDLAEHSYIKRIRSVKTDVLITIFLQFLTPFSLFIDWWGFNLPFRQGLLDFIDILLLLWLFLWNDFFFRRLVVLRFDGVLWRVNEKGVFCLEGGFKHAGGPAFDRLLWSNTTLHIKDLI